MGSWSRREGTAPAFQANNTPCFFMIVHQRAQALLQDGKLEVPKRAVREHGDNMADTIFLEVPDGAVWPIKLTRHDGKIWLRNGWPQFVKFYDIEHRYLLMFSYEGVYSHFKVRIYRRNTLEVDYFSSDTDGDEAEGNSNPSGESEGQGMKHDTKKRTHGGSEGTSEAQRSSEVHAMESFEDLKDGVPSRAKSSKSDEDGDVVSVDILEDFPPCPKPTKKSPAGKSKMGRVNGGQVTQRSHNSSLRAPEAATEFVSDNPFFRVTVRSPHNVPLPVAFSMHITRKTKQPVTLQVGDRMWPVTLLVHCVNTFQLSAGWAAFAKDNRLRAGDVCIFELIDRNDILIKVHTFGR